MNITIPIMITFDITILYFSCLKISDKLDIIKKILIFVDLNYFALLNHVIESTLLLIAILTLNSLSTCSFATLSFLQAYSCQ